MIFLPYNRWAGVAQHLADLEGGLECISVCSGVTFDLGFEDDCTFIGGAFTGGCRSRRKI